MTSSAWHVHSQVWWEESQLLFWYIHPDLRKRPKQVAKRLLRRPVANHHIGLCERTVSRSEYSTNDVAISRLV